MAQGLGAKDEGLAAVTQGIQGKCQAIPQEGSGTHAGVVGPATRVLGLRLGFRAKRVEAVGGVRSSLEKDRLPRALVVGV
eukprot:2862623-Rhodomonas_salina.2